MQSESGTPDDSISATRGGAADGARPRRGTVTARPAERKCRLLEQVHAGKAGYLHRKAADEMKGWLKDWLKIVAPFLIFDAIILYLAFKRAFA